MSRLPCLYPVYIAIIKMLILNQWNGFFINKSRIIPFIFSDHFSFLFVLNKSKNKSMGICLSKFNDKPFTLHTARLTSEHLKKVTSGTRKSPVKHFATGMHQKYGIKVLLKVLKIALWMYMIHFLHNLLSY